MSEAKRRLRYKAKHAREPWHENKQGMGGTALPWFKVRPSLHMLCVKWSPLWLTTESRILLPLPTQPSPVPQTANIVTLDMKLQSLQPENTLLCPA